MDAITLADAMELFKLPRTLGETPEGEAIVANVGRFGPYVKYGSKYASLKEDDPYTISLERAREVIRLKKEADAARLIQDFPDEGIQVLNGRYGPYITDKKKNAKIPKERDPRSLTLEECRALLAAAPERGRFGRWGRGKRAAAPATDAASAPGRDGAQQTAGEAAPARRKGARKKAAPDRSSPKSVAANQPPVTASARSRAKASAHAGRKAHRRAKAVARKSAAGKARAKTSGVAQGRARGLKQS
jgi:DNA topoisomerase-1